MKILESTFYTLRLFSIGASGACTERQSVASLAIHFQKVDSSGRVDRHAIATALARDDRKAA
ncbi:hypothetical protein [Helicobacter canis]|uniref:Uncharacterized protein n=1 Tax=Helicobacter canis TaxID=29419 RepID=A0A377J2D7_9HELI|nr:hypothetical protein [Helicobacter canis]STO96641.1 Uncharacterised protein [Helicobacter canis]